MYPLWVIAFGVMVFSSCVLVSQGLRERHAVRAFDSVVTNDTTIARGFGLVAVESGSEAYRYRLGVSVVCDREARSLTARLHFGPLPVNKAVQPMVGRPGGAVRFGTAVPAGVGSASGFHWPVLEDTGEVLRFVELAFRHGAVISDGRSEIRNRIPVPQNEAARLALSLCAEPWPEPGAVRSGVDHVLAGTAWRIDGRGEWR